ncbi:segregation and condensation protein A [Actinoalloteichus hymeniacidonis]|uniref:Segregation and condensation protein A n=1 Tax=Actinoalloteichus hymeniacidonis TaxID=340345 RepID=A0AAC9MYH1_9PSEU|nr:segregation/condensation protein A [Actinoalloteichus hymeniacidonis]AOS64393.1 condensin subunit ScpA [Actinoalloteichus hymeniacidonis]MBB5907539.1 segregation and condensation protein A [Actinoalloteichus hymeniacidonis]
MTDSAAGPDPGPAAVPTADAAPQTTATIPQAEPSIGAEGPAVDPAAGAAADGRFTVRLHNFEGPFDLLLQLISQHRMDVTEVALHRVTDEFIAHIRRLGDEWDLDEITEFLVIAATLLDLKAARLLPAAEVEDEEDLALLEARDLLFARLLQYRAYKQVAGLFSELEAGALRRYPRSVALEERFDGLLPEVLLGVDADRFAEIAAAVFRPRPPPTVSLDHIHMARVSVREHAAFLRVLLAERGEAWFGELTEDCGTTVEVVARFLALLELYREMSVLFDQSDPLGDLRVRWVGGSVEHAKAVAEIDRTAVEDEEYG